MSASTYLNNHTHLVILTDNNSVITITDASCQSSGRCVQNIASRTLFSVKMDTVRWYLHLKKKRAITITSNVLLSKLNSLAYIRNLYHHLVQSIIGLCSLLSHACCAIHKGKHISEMATIGVISIYHYNIWNESHCGLLNKSRTDSRLNSKHDFKFKLS